MRVFGIDRRYKVEINVHETPESYPYGARVGKFLKASVETTRRTVVFDLNAFNITSDADLEATALHEVLHQVLQPLFWAAEEPVERKRIKRMYKADEKIVEKLEKVINNLYRAKSYKEEK
jgi:cob(I)alamin adenosyltransferase